MSDYFVSIEMERAFSTTFHIKFVISPILHCICFYCLIRETPQNQHEVRFFLMFLQIVVAVQDVVNDIMLEPIPLLPLPAAYFVGLGVRIGVPLNLILSLEVASSATMAVSIILCFLHKHQTIIDDLSRLKMRKRVYHLLCFCCGCMCTFIFIAVLTSPSDFASSNRAIATYKINITWIRQRGPYMVLEKNLYTRAAGLLFLTNALISGISTNAMYWHILHYLNNATSSGSVSTRNMIKRSVLALYIQLFAPSFFLGLPMVICFLFLSTDTGDFMTCYVLCYILQLHSPAHSIVLLSITPAYRRFLLSFFPQRSRVKQHPYRSLPHLPRQISHVFLHIGSALHRLGIHRRPSISFE
ncbi:hypothetical protein PRIPAC_88861 [Pristionchus pacificus]|uniref:G protein-coupled receptor n=1 Tax=Pristionchus pacificus TaxID=54126 RepID=A0A2A6CXQ4_PRIPA|nr:hypothetical protein PRIPAC_88861 [Pristionchus pacificus]|eukprot:PDM82918.1 G protein-coupled receptor [Pristionchus pacificus]